MQRNGHRFLQPALGLLLAIGAGTVNAQEPPPARLPAFDDGRFQLDAEGKALDGQHVTAPLPDRTLRIAILPDRTTGRDWGMPYLEAAVRDLARHHPDAIFTVGDMVQGYTRDAARYDREIDEYLHVIRPISDRFYPTPGNHDVISGDRDPEDTRFAERYRQRFGPLHYSVEVDDATVIVLFSDESMGDGALRLSDEQLAWLEQRLETVSEGPTILLMHRPLWRYASVGWWERVQPLLARHEVDAVIAGHFHAMQKDETRDDVEYHILGTCGGMVDQHPLTGQVQHISLLQLDPDAAHGKRFSLHHQVVGTTLPDDFILAEDQNRIWQLKNGPQVATILGSIPDTANGRFEVPLEIELRNPLDRHVSFTIEPSNAPGAWTADDDATWRSLTDLDTFNPHTMHGLGRSMIQIKEAVVLEPGATTIVDAAVISRARTGSAPGRPPQLDITASFNDTQGRRVPVLLRRRIPLERNPVVLTPGGEPASLPLCAWTFSVYDRVEPDPECLLSLDEDGHLVLEVMAPGDLLAGPGPDQRPLTERTGNPMADAILVELGAPEHPARETIYWELTSDDGVHLLEDGSSRPLTRTALNSGSAGWHARLRLPTPLVDGEIIRVAVSDNDETYHSQWRSLTPPDLGLVVEIGD
jgi:UDP-2,3-diacylglucosamine pyrophosphatase LpxH